MSRVAGAPAAALRTQRDLITVYDRQLPIRPQRSTRFQLIAKHETTMAANMPKTRQRRRLRRRGPRVASTLTRSTPAVDAVTCPYLLTWAAHGGHTRRCDSRQSSSSSGGSESLSCPANEQQTLNEIASGHHFPPLALLQATITVVAVVFLVSVTALLFIPLMAVQSSSGAD